jgi:uncharacterized phiE125 gp8 family phage protein
MGLVLITPPTVEPVSVEHLARHCRVDDPEEFEYLESLGIAARLYCETYTRRAFCTQTWQFLVDRFPNYWQDWQIWSGRRMWARSNRRLSTDAYRDITLRIEKPPVQSITAITYTDNDGALQTLPGDQWMGDLREEPARLTPTYGNYWPTARYQIDAVCIEFVAGYGDPCDVPQTIKAAIKLLVAHWYLHREAVTTESAPQEMPISCKALLGSEQWGSYMSG